MSARRMITTHHGAGGIDEQISIEAAGTPSDVDAYIVTTGLNVAAIRFHVARSDEHGRPMTTPNGLTNETLLAIVRDRLERFESGAFSCPENRRALAGIRDAMTALQDRTRARREQGVEGKYAQHVSAEKIMGGDATPCNQTVGRITLTESSVVIDLPMPVTMPRDMLKDSWGNWHQLERHLKRLDPPVCRDELTLLQKIPTSVAGRNGYAELASALRGLVGD